MSYAMLADFLTEFFATFLFVIIVGMTYAESISVVALAVGLGAAVLVASERVDMNPVVSIAIALCDQVVGWGQLFTRILAQLVGSILGGLVAIGSWRREELNFAEKAASSAAKALSFEIVFACLLVLVVLRTRETGVGAFAHGLCYTVAIFCGMNVFEGNALINPASAIGLMSGSNSFKSSTDESSVWLYIVGPFIGALLAVMIYQLTEFLDDDEDDEGVEVEETTEYVKTTVVTPVEQVRHKPQAETPGNNGYGQRAQPAVTLPAQQPVTPPQVANTYPVVSRNSGYQPPANGMRYSTQSTNIPGQNRYVQPQYID